MEKIKLNIDGREVEADPGQSVLDAALSAGIYIPHLCSHPDLEPAGACRLCLVEIEGLPGLPASCVTPALPGMVVRTKSPDIDRMRRLAMDLLLTGHPPECSECSRYLSCELQSVKQVIGTVDENRLRRRARPFPENHDNPLFVHDPVRCIQCGRCVRACRDLRGVGVLSMKVRDGHYYIGTDGDRPLAEVGCRFCGACVEVCPTGALRDKDELMKGRKRRAALVPCRHACPAEIDVPRYVRFIKEKKYAEAAATIREKAPLPGVLGHVCNHPCEAVCRRGEVNQPVSIRDLKRFAAERDDGRLWETGVQPASSTGKRVAIVGSGPAGLTAAHCLARVGHEVTVFEALPQAGGMLRVGIPEYRLPRHVLEAEIRDIERLGVEIRTGTKIESLDALTADGYEAAVVAVGAHQGVKLRMPGGNLGSVLVGVDFLRAVHLGQKVSLGRRVLVLGGGNVAFDCARVARRLGAEEVRLACLESRESMPADDDEIREGEEEGILVFPARTFSRIAAEDGCVTGVECLEVSSCEFDEEGGVQIEAVENSEHFLAADTVIFAIGQKPAIPGGFDLETGRGGRIVLDEFTFETSRPGIFAAGDAATGTASVIEAIASGRKAAAAVDQYLGGGGLIDETFAPEEEPQTCLGREEGFADQTRRGGQCASLECRLTGFDEISAGLEEKDALAESGRCLQCDLRLSITPVKFWGDY